MDAVEAAPDLIAEFEEPWFDDSSA